MFFRLMYGFLLLMPVVGLMLAMLLQDLSMEAVSNIFFYIAIALLLVTAVYWLFHHDVTTHSRTAWQKFLSAISPRHEYVNEAAPVNKNRNSFKAEKIPKPLLCLSVWYLAFSFLIALFAF